MLEESLRAEMAYHCRSLELLQAICVDVRQLDPDRAVKVSEWVVVVGVGVGVVIVVVIVVVGGVGVVVGVVVMILLS